jgi:hypothetical protein
MRWGTWERQTHPDDGKLLLHLEGELKGRESETLSRHIQACWQCRARSERLHRSICAFAEYRDRVILSHLPPPEADHQAFSRRLTRLERGLPSGETALRVLVEPVAQLWTNHRASWLSSLIAMGVMAVLAVSYVGHPPLLSAAVVLERAHRQAREQDPRPGKIIRQRIEFRKGNQVLEREIVHTATGAAEARAPADVAWRDLMSFSSFSWADPLSPDQFADWRNSLSSKRDQVLKSADTVTVITTPLAPSTVIQASITVRNTDWHAEAKRVAFGDGSVIEIREISYEISSSVFVAGTGHRMGKGGEERQLVSSELLATDAELDEAEISLLELFHRLGTDRIQLPDFFRRDHRVYFRLDLEDVGLRSEVIAAAVGIPFTSAEPGSHDTVLAVQTLASPPYVIYPPFIEELDHHTGSAAASRQALEQLREALNHTEEPARGLAFLAGRYAEGAYVRLAPNLSHRLDSIAADYVRNLKQSQAELERVLSPILDSLGGDDESDSSDFSEASARIPSIPSWLSLGPILSSDSVQLERTLAQMFYVRSAAQPENLVRGEVLARARLLNNRLRVEMARLREDN